MGEKEKIYFACSIRGGRGDADIYSGLAEHLKRYGKVLNVHIADPKLSHLGENLDERAIHDRDMGWLNEAGKIVAEVTTASTGVGYELGRIVERNLWVPQAQRKHMLCLYRPQIDKKLSAMIKGSQGLRNAEYHEFEEAIKAIDDFFREIKEGTSPVPYL